MASAITKLVAKVCVQDAIYWAPGALDGYGGMAFAAPQVVKVRWDDKAEVITRQDGKQVTSQAEILTPNPLAYLGYLKLVQPGDPEPPVNPVGYEGAFEIARTQTTPLYRSSTDFVYQVFLSAPLHI